LQIKSIVLCVVRTDTSYNLHHDFWVIFLTHIKTVNIKVKNFEEKLRFSNHFGAGLHQQNGNQISKNCLKNKIFMSIAHDFLQDAFILNYII